MQQQKSFCNTNQTLYIIPTPIGNLDDITYRSINVLKELDYLFCEDTRVTKKLLSHYEIDIKTYPYHEYNKNEAGQKILNLLKKGTDVGLVSDAGMPGISDPGYDIIRQVKAENINVVVLPGASAFIVSIVHSSLVAKQFMFWGFLNKQNSKKKKELEEILHNKYPTIIYESPHKLLKTLKLIAELNDQTEVHVSREISKKFEEYTFGKVTEIIDFYERLGVKGECVIIIKPPILETKVLDPLTMYKKLIEEGYTKKEAIKKVSKENYVAKNDIYQLVLESEKSE